MPAMPTPPICSPPFSRALDKALWFLEHIQERE
jgi:hypothetical protein